MAIDRNQLPVGESAYIRGQVTFSRLTKPYEGESLKKYNEGRRFPQTSPFTTISIKNATILCFDQANPTLLERFIAEQLWQSKKEPNVNCYTGINKSGRPPMVGHKDQATGAANEIVLEKELANDSNVTLMVRVYQSKAGNRGVGLEAVIIEDPQVRYFEPNQVSSELAKRGIVWNSMDPEEKARRQQAAAAAQPVQMPADPAAQTAMPYQASAPTPQEMAATAQAAGYAAPAYAGNAYTAPARPVPQMAAATAAAAPAPAAAVPATPGFYGTAPAADGYMEAPYYGEDSGNDPYAGYDASTMP